MKYLILLCLLVTGCSTSPAQKVGIGFVTFTGTTNSMSALAEANKLDIEDAETFESYRAPAWDLLQAAKTDVLDGDNDMFTATQALDMLIPILEQMENINARASTTPKTDP